MSSNDAEVKAKTGELNECLLSQYQATVAGLLAGGSVSLLRTPVSLLPLFTAGVAGSSVDLAYGYNVACASHVEAANRAMKRPGYD